LKGGARRTYEGQERRTQDLGGGNLRERDHFEDLRGDVKILQQMFKKGDGGMN
jgi:hypothetical protein